MTDDEPRISSASSLDGTEIAYWTSGEGPPLVLVHGAPADHTRWSPLLPHLEPHFTVHAIDRRSRGASGDSPEYAVQREFEDVAAVVDNVATHAGRPVCLYGHSLGGLVALGAATLTSNIHKLVLYEGWPVVDPAVFALPEALQSSLDALVAARDRDALVELFFREALGMSDEEMAALKATPSWAGRVAAAHTITREVRGVLTAQLDPELARTITAAALLVTGEKSIDASRANIETVAASLPNARILVLQDQGHIADVLAPQLFAARVLPFLMNDS